MAAHRYWRARAFEASAEAIVLSEFHLLDAAGARLDESATLTASADPSSGAVANLQDDDTATSVRWAARRGLALFWDFGAAGAVDVASVRVGAGDTGPGEFPFFCGVEWSDDGVSFTQLAVLMATFPGARQKTAGFLGWTPTDSAVTLQLGFRGANGATSFTDDVAGNSWMRVGAAQIKTDQYRWGGSSGYFNGADAGLFMPSKDAMNMGASRDFVIECWFRVGAFVNAYGTLLASGTTTFTGGSKFLMVYGDASPIVGLRRKVAFGGEPGSYGNPLVTSTTTLLADTWYRVKVVRVGATVFLYLNDVLEAQVNDARVVDLGASGTRVGYNGWDGAAGYFQGHIGEMRVVSGSGESGFAPQYVRHPVPSKFMPTPPLSPVVVASALTVPKPFGTAVAEVGKMRPDFYSGVLGKGIGRIRGFTLDYVNPLNKPYRCRVVLMREAGNLVVREQWSKADGSYDFQYVDELQSYSVVAYYEAHGKRAVVTDGLTLANGKVELMP
jgi:hypothetical protein